jgi:HlyD family secretion protein
MKKFIIFLILAAIVAGGVYGYMQWRKGQQAATLTNLQTVAAERGELVATIGATGQVRSKQTTTLIWKTSGTVKEVNAQVGDLVKTGAKLAELEQTSLPQNIILAQADLVSARKALADLDTAAENASIQALQAIATNAQQVKSAQYQLDNFTIPEIQAGMSTMEALDYMQKKLDQARAAFEPYKYLPSSDKTREDRLDDLNQAQADYNAAVKRLEYEYAVEIATTNLKKARQDYEKWKNGPDPDDVAAAQARIAAAEAALQQTWIDAPFNGTITVSDLQPGDQVAAGETAFRIDDLSELFVGVSVSEVDINQVKMGQDVNLTFDAIWNKDYHGVVTDVDNVGNIVQGAVEFVVTVKLTDADEEIKPGMTAAVNIVVNRLEDVLLVPNRAVRMSNSEQVVYILKDNQVVPVKIDIGASSDAMSQITGGDLEVGAQIILNPPTVFEQNGPPPFVRGGP